MSLRPASLVILVCLAGAAAAFETSGCAATTSAASAGVVGTKASSAESRLYRFDFTLTSKGDPKTARAYSMTVEQGRQGELRSGANVPLGGDAHARMDTGLRLKCRYDVAGDDVLAHVELEQSDSDTSPTQHKMSVESDALVAPGTPTLVATLEDSATRERFDLTVAASRLH